MAKRVRKKAATEDTGDLKGWQQIAGFLGEPTSVVQRWAAQGMPVRRQGRYITTTADELNRWLGGQSGKPVHVATDNTDLTAELKRGISFVHRNRGGQSGDHATKPEKSTECRSH